MLGVLQLIQKCSVVNVITSCYNFPVEFRVASVLKDVGGKMIPKVLRHSRRVGGGGGGWLRGYLPFKILKFRLSEMAFVVILECTFRGYAILLSNNLSYQNKKPFP